MSNGIDDLKNIMFNQLRRMDRSVGGNKESMDRFRETVEQTKAMTGLSRQLINLHTLKLEAVKSTYEYVDFKLPKCFEESDE